MTLKGSNHHPNRVNVPNAAITAGRTRTSTDEAVSADVFPARDTLEHKAVPRVLRDS